MRALVLASGRATVRDDRPDPVAAPGESRVAVRLAGVCATDLALARGYMGFEGVPGHEFVGTALDGPLAGRRVVGEINAGCGRCADCARGDPRHCPARTVLGILGRDGAMAERLVLPTRNLLPVPEGVSDEEAVFAEPLAAALHVSDALPDVAGTRVLVAGDGRLGLLCAHALALAGAEVTVAGRHPERRPLLPARAVHVVGLLESAHRAEAAPLARAELFDAAVEATGRADVLPRLLALVRPTGTIVLKTTSEAPTPVELAPLVVQEQRLVGSRCGRLPVALQALAQRRVPVGGLVVGRYPLARADEALRAAAGGGVLKLLIEVGG